MAIPRQLRSDDPREIGGYRLLGRLGEGGQGVVYLGQAPDGSRVAVKVLHTRLAGDTRSRGRFLREVAVTRRVAQFCTVRVLEVNLEDGRPYVVSELVDGVSLHEHVASHGPCEAAMLVRLAVGTAAALASIHRAGVVHRDFKPSNVLLGPDGPRVIDFGIARVLDAAATQSSSIVGTPSYMSPEQFTSAAVSPRSDLFSWASTMIFAASGRPPFGADAVPAVMGRIINEEADLSPIPPSLRPAVERCLAKDPHRRPNATEVLLTLLGNQPDPAEAATAGAGRDLLTRAVRSAATTLPDTRRAPLPPPPPPALPRPFGPSRSRRWRWVLLSLVTIVGVAIATASTVLRPSDDGWQQRADLAYFTSYHRVAAFEGQIWVIGRWSWSEGDVVEIYDPGSDQWASGPPLPEGLHLPKLVSTVDELYLLGGVTDDLSASLPDVYRLDGEPASETRGWQSAAPLPAPRGFGAAVWDGTRVIYASGLDVADEERSTEVLGFQDSQWRTLGDTDAGYGFAASDGSGQVWLVSSEGVQTVINGTISDHRDADDGWPETLSTVFWSEKTGLCLVGFDSPLEYLERLERDPVAGRVHCTESGSRERPVIPAPPAAHGYRGATVLDGVVYLVMTTQENSSIDPSREGDRLTMATLRLPTD